MATTPFHARPAAEALETFKTGRHGLTAAEAEQRLEHYGPNRLPPPKRRGPLRRLAAQFANLLIYVLLAAALVTALLDEWVKTGVILGVVVINALIGFIQEGKAENALEAIRAMLAPRAAVTRDGRRATLPAEELVPGDIVHLKSGDRVPADLRLVEVRNLQVEEAALTGESLAVDKDPEPVSEDAPLGDRRAMAYSSTLVVYGTAVGVVVATGPQTEIGRISHMLADVSRLTTPLLEQMDRFARWLTLAILGLAGLVFALGVLVQGKAITEMFMAAVALAVAAIPEGLPAILTIALAIGVTRMARRNAIIRRLPAVETLGSVGVICSDKTGTLTRNELTVQRVVTAAHAYRVSGAGYDPAGEFSLDNRPFALEAHPDLQLAARAAMLCNDAELAPPEEGIQDGWRLHGNPTDGALLAVGMKAGYRTEFEREANPRTDVIPFESEHKFMATLHHDHAGHGTVFVKGAPERILAMCTQQRRGGADEPLDAETWHARVDAMAGEGQRVIAVACKPADAGRQALRFADVDTELSLVALFGLIDPPRPEAIRAVAQCREAGIRVKMITGDHARTARAVAWQLGLAGPDGGEPDALTGNEIDRLDLEGLRRAALTVDVFARTTPAHKLHLVEALQAADEVVAMTGDGVNDAPALKRADVGVAMGHKGTQAASEAAEMVLADDNFASIANAVEEGRTAYDNIRKAILFILPTNGGQAMTILLAVALGWMLPITPLQILWVNMVTAVTLALALAFERTEAGVMARPPRLRHEPLLSAFLVWRIVFVSLLLVVGTFGLYAWYRAHGLDIETARAIAVNTLVVGEAVYLLNSRRMHGSALTRESLDGIGLPLAAIAMVMAIQMPFTYWGPMQALFGTGPLSVEQWGWIALFGLALFVLVEAEKALVRHVVEPAERNRLAGREAGRDDRRPLECGQPAWRQRSIKSS
ncbi:MAG: HAD-IC family P-type ATPase [Alphaproteobacteria bacterium]|jgi:magnesium-transporting ATPase (P-type)|nr:HAD-IC family P-type ATPase [Alphaproteobacteria bacterium]